LEGDAQTVVTAINSLVFDRSRLGHIVEDVRLEVQDLGPWKFTFVKRDGNHAAHSLSKFAAHNALDQTWRDEKRDYISLEQSTLDV
jgi:hypothetical protein